MSERVAIVAGVRTPFCKAGSSLSYLSAVELGRMAVRELVARSEVDPAVIDELVYGTVVHSVQEPNIAREVGLSTVGTGVPAYTVSRACASANQAIVNAAESILNGTTRVAIAGGSESLSNIPILVSKPLSEALVRASKAKSFPARLASFAGFRPSWLAPITPAIAEPSTGETMGQSADKMAKMNAISREAQDRWALRSHQLAQAATEDGRLTAEIVPIYQGKEIISRDNGIRADTSYERLAQLKPVFDRVDGTVTAGNASPITDGASAVMLMSESRARELGVRPLGYLRSWAWASVDPAWQLLQAPAFCAPVALDRAGLTMKDIDLLDMHEAFAAQVLSNLQAFDSDSFARERLGRDRAMGLPHESRINVMGGSIAMGHPFGATGGRITISILNELRRRRLQFGLITVCAAGGMGFAMVVEAA